MSRDLRISMHVERGPRVRFTFDGRPVDAHAGESVAAALWADGVAHAADRVAHARGVSALDSCPPWRVMFCMMGVCQQCVVVIDGIRVEACRVLVRPGLEVRSA